MVDKCTAPTGVQEALNLENHCCWKKIALAIIAPWWHIHIYIYKNNIQFKQQFGIFNITSSLMPCVNPHHSWRWPKGTSHIWTVTEGERGSISRKPLEGNSQWVTSEVALVEKDPLVLVEGEKLGGRGVLRPYNRATMWHVAGTGTAWKERTMGQWLAWWCECRLTNKGSLCSSSEWYARILPA